MSVHFIQAAELHPRHLQARDRRVVGERIRIAGQVRASARDLFPYLRDRLLASRPLLEVVDEGYPEERRVYGKPTFRNVIENGRHV